MNTKNEIHIKQPEGGLIQSREWADVLRSEKKEIMEVKSGEDTIFGSVQKIAMFGSYSYFPRLQHITSDAFVNICSLKCGWIRFDANTEDVLNVFKGCGLQICKAPHNMQPKENFIIDITKTEEELLAEMKSKTRYNVRLAKKKGVKVFTTTDEKYVDIFCDLVNETSYRKDVNFHSRDHYEKIISEMPNDVIKLYVAEYEGKVIAANIISFYNGVATYLHGATSDKSRNVMAPFLLQWQAIKDAKEKNCQWYDFGGVFPDSQDPGKKGITRFKQGFAPNEKSFVTAGSYDIVLKPRKYNLYRILQKFK